MPTPTAPPVSLDDILVVKTDLDRFATKDDLAREAASLRAEIGSVRDDLTREIGSVRDDLGSAVRLIMGELGKYRAAQEESNKVLGGLVRTVEIHGNILARLIAKVDGVDLESTPEADEAEPDA